MQQTEPLYSAEENDHPERAQGHLKVYHVPGTRGSPQQGLSKRIETKQRGLNIKFLADCCK